MNPLYIHCHIFKNAGTSLIEAFKIAFPGRAAELEPDHPDSFFGVADIEKYLEKNPDTVFISSHRILLPLPDKIVGREVFAIVLLRSPIKRLESVYRFEHKEPRRSVYSVLSKIASYEEFLSSILAVDYLPIISNVQSTFCGISNEVDIKNLRIERQKILWGMVERYDESLTLIEDHVNKFYQDTNLPIIKENTTQDNKLLTNLTHINDPALLDKLVFLNTLDQKLVKKVTKSLFKSTTQKKIVNSSLANTQIKISRWVRIDSSEKPIKLLACRLEYNTNTKNFVFENEDILYLELRIANNHSASRLRFKIDVVNHTGRHIRTIKETLIKELLSTKISDNVFSFKLPLKIENLETGLYSLSLAILNGYETTTTKIAEYPFIAAFGIKSLISDAL